MYWKDIVWREDGAVEFEGAPPDSSWDLILETIDGDNYLAKYDRDRNVFVQIPSNEIIEDTIRKYRRIAIEGEIPPPFVHKDKPDPKYLGIPNINFSLTSRGDVREEGYARQRIERGFDVSELWSLDRTIAHFIFPRIKEFSEIIESVLDEGEFIEDVKKIVKTFEIMCDEDKYYHLNKEEREIEEGLRLFVANFRSLWW